MARHFFLVYSFFISLFAAVGGFAQEATAPVHYNPRLTKRPVLLNTLRTTATTASLPFFEDFTTYSVYPDSNLWGDYQIYINNTMGVRPISRGVATFDALDYRGIPYDSFNNTVFRYADSLTSRPIDMSFIGPADSVYLSFFYQPQGNGFYPLLQDSLMLFLKTKYGGFAKIWSTPGSTLQPFRQVMIPITDSIYFHTDFQFRFINKAALYYSDAIWNVDYIRLNSNRTITDTAVNDPAITSDPTVLLNDYTAMPYRQFLAAPSGERVTTISDSIRNNFNFTQSLSYYFTSTALNTGTVLQAPSGSTIAIPATTTMGVSVPAYTSVIPASSVGYHDRVVFEHKYFFDLPAGVAEPTVNDTIVRSQVFDNYLAYDDGSAEKSYYLNLFSTLPGKLQIEHHLNTPDTMQGMAIYFGRQIPFAFYKSFTIEVYSALAGVNGAPADVLLYSQDLCDPGYADTINHFWIYKFNQPLPLPAGTFYAGTLQPAESGADSLYFGLDVNRVGSNHAYYSVLNMWNPSLISGAIMIRPLLGQAVQGSGISSVGGVGQWQLAPNPAHDIIRLNYSSDADATYTISDMQGRAVGSGTLNREKTINVSGLSSGMYMIQLSASSLSPLPQKFIKL